MFLRKYLSICLTAVLITLTMSCGGGGGTDSVGDPNEGVSDDGNNADEGDDGISPNENANPGEPISSVSFDLTGAIGLAIDDSSSDNSALTVDGPIATTSNLKRVNPDNSLSDAVDSGSVTVRSFMVAAGNQVYLLLSTAVDSCILIRVDGETNESTCVDSTLSQINWSNAFGDPIQFDSDGNIYYQGSTNDGRTILRLNSSGVTSDLINDYISLKGFLVLHDGTVFYAGTTNPTGTYWTRIVTPERSLTTLLPSNTPNFLALFPDNNVYFGLWSTPWLGMFRYLTATKELDDKQWVGNDAEIGYYDCVPNFSNGSYPCSSPRSIVKTTNRKVYAILNKSSQSVLAQLYPIVLEANTSVTDVTVFESILTYILLGGFDSQNNNKLVLYNTDTDTETDLLSSENIEVYHVSYLNSSNHQIVMFDGLRFSDIKYVLCQVDLTDNNALTCSETDTGKLTDFQLFDDADTIAGGGTNSTKTYTIGGTVSGLKGSLVLRNNGEDTLTLSQDGAFTFPIAVDSDYNVTIQSSPDEQTCTLSNGSGIVSDKHVTSVSVVCVGYTISGTINGLIGTLVLQNNGGDDLTLSQNGSFTFATTLPNAAAYKVTIQSGPKEQTCTVSNGSGIISDNDVTSVSIVCIGYTISGTTTGLIGTLILQNNGGDDLTLNRNGSFNFATTLPNAAVYKVTVKTAPLGQNCILSQETGVISKNNITEVSVVCSTPPGVIVTLAGGGNSYPGDGGGAWDASLSVPYNIVFDNSGSFYISECSRIRKVAVDGTIITVAGTTGSWGFSGDGGVATSAKLSCPWGIMVDSADNLYISDTGNHRIRKVDTNGIITTIVGTGIPGFSGDGGLATNARLNFPNGVAIDVAGNLYVADSSNVRIRKIDTNGVITTIAGNGLWGFSGDGGAATNAKLQYPQGLAIDPSGNLYIADSGNVRIRKVDANGIITTVAGNGIAGFEGDGGLAKNAQLYYPRGIALDSLGHLYIADTSNNRIRKVDTGGTITTVAGNGTVDFSGDGGSATSAGLNYPQGIAVDPSGNLYIADTHNSRVRMVAGE